MGRREMASTIVLLQIVAGSSQAFAQDNQGTCLAVHAVPTELVHCDIGDPCNPGPPTVGVESNQRIAVYLIARHYHAIMGVQTAFDWHDWTFLFGIWDQCNSSQVVAHAPGGSGGPREGTLSTAFDCVTGGETFVIGSMHFVSGVECLSQVASALPFGTHVLDPYGVPTPVQEHNLGMVCVSHLGYDACEQICPSVDQSSWGKLRRTYEQ